MKNQEPRFESVYTRFCAYHQMRVYSFVRAENNFFADSVLISLNSYITRNTFGLCDTKYRIKLTAAAKVSNGKPG